MADNTRRVLQKAYSGHTGLSWGWLADTAEVVAANPAALFDAMVADGMARAVVWCPVHRWEVLNERHGTDRCTHADQHVTRYEVVLPKPPEPPVDTEKQIRDRFFPNDTLDCAACGVEVHNPHRLRHAQWHKALEATLLIEVPS